MYPALHETQTTSFPKNGSLLNGDAQNNFWVWPKYKESNTFPDRSVNSRLKCNFVLISDTLSDWNG
jgi:hypothetical protein